MVIQSWIIAGLVAGWLVGMMLGRGYGIAGDIILGIIGGLVGGSLASILFVVSGEVNQANVIAAIITFICAEMLFTLKRVMARQVGYPLNPVEQRPTKSVTLGRSARLYD
jgi:uncharacterized membrane protein YeaQ/YmgE (transglycosylase-associated protein family)